MDVDVVVDESESEEDPFVGRTLGGGKFRIEALVKAGAMGAIYRAHHIPLDKTVCVKVMHRQLANDPRFIERFHREAKAASRLEHPSSVHVLDFGREPEPDATLFIVMEFLHGRDLFEVLQEEGPLEPRRIVDILSQTLSVLAVAHDARILHRDLKPENIMLCPSVASDDDSRELVKVCDFGIAKISSADEIEIDVDGDVDNEEVVDIDVDVEDQVQDASLPRLTTQGLVIGTPEYMSPEQACGANLDRRSDLYSVGAILYHMLTGRMPFEGDSMIGIVLKQIHEEPVPPMAVNPNAHPELSAICMRALQKNPADRFSSAREMRTVLRRALDVRDSNPTITPPIVATTITGQQQAFVLDVAREESEWFEHEQQQDNERDYDPRPSLLASITSQPAPRRFRRSGYLGAIAATLVVMGVAFLNTHRGNAATTTTISAATIPVQTAEAEPAPAPAPTAATPAPTPTPTPTPTIAEPTHVAPAPTTIAPRAAQPTAARPTAKAITTTTATADPTQPEAEPASAAPPVIEEPPVAAPPPTVETPTAPAPITEKTSPAPASAVHSRVELGAPTRVAGATTSGFQRAVSSAKLDSCFRSALPQLRSAPDGASSFLHVETDDVGVITRAQLNGSLQSELGVCVSKAAMGARVSNVDTGTASADFPITYRAR